MMKKKTMSYVMTGALSFTIWNGVASSPAQAASPQLIKVQTAPSVTRAGTRDFADVMAEQAAALGVYNEADDLETTAQKVRTAKLERQVEALGIDTAGKTEKVLRMEVKKAHEALVHTTADRLGIQRDGLRTRDIISAIAEVNKAEAEPLKGFY
jgi:hypothetical protein